MIAQARPCALAQPMVCSDGRLFSSQKTSTPVAGLCCRCSCLLDSDGLELWDERRLQATKHKSRLEVENRRLTVRVEQLEHDISEVRRRRICLRPVVAVNSTNSERLSLWGSLREVGAGGGVGAGPLERVGISMWEVSSRGTVQFGRRTTGVLVLEPDGGGVGSAVRLLRLGLFSAHNWLSRSVSELVSKTTNDSRTTQSPSVSDSDQAPHALFSIWRRRGVRDSACAR